MEEKPKRIYSITIYLKSGNKIFVRTTAFQWNPHGITYTWDMNIDITPTLMRLDADQVEAVVVNGVEDGVSI